jgi:hypothetical protein
MALLMNMNRLRNNFHLPARRRTIAMAAAPNKRTTRQIWQITKQGALADLKLLGEAKGLHAASTTRRRLHGGGQGWAVAPTHVVASDQH